MNPGKYEEALVHGGELSVETKEGEYLEFIVVLPDRS
jgi:hypothetical protein